MNIQLSLLMVMLAIQVQAFCQTTSDNSLIAHYLFNGDTRDQSMYRNDGTVLSGVKYGPDRYGSICGALEFDGKNGYVKVPTSVSLESPTTSLSIAVWFKLHKAAEDLQWFSVACKGINANESPNSPQYRLQGTRVTLSLNTDFTESTTMPLQNGTWYHYVMTWDGHQVRSFLNGKPLNTFEYTGRLGKNTDPLYIGRDIPGVDEYFYGSLDELIIFNRKLSEQEVWRIYMDDSEKDSPKPCDQSKTVVRQDPLASAPKAYPQQTLQSQGLPPIITVLLPQKNALNTSEKIQTIWARIQYIQSEKDITILVNGRPIHQYNYTAETNLLELPVTLQEGANLIEVQAKNQFGNDKESILIAYTAEVEKQSNTTPSIRFVYPTDDLSVTNQSESRIFAKVSNLEEPGSITASLNGKELKSSTYSYDKNSGLFDASIQLQPGMNVFKINVQNPAGRISEVRLLNFQNPEQKASPVNSVSDSPKPELSLGTIQVVDEVITPQSTIYLSCFDHNKIDGDIVSVVLEDQGIQTILFDKIMLTGKTANPHTKQLALTKGNEYLLISKAWNEGSVPTNTLCIEFTDNQGFSKVMKLNSRNGTSEAVRVIYK